MVDPGEDITILTLDEDEVRAGVHDGTLSHSLMLTALARVLDLRSPKLGGPKESP